MKAKEPQNIWANSTLLASDWGADTISWNRISAEKKKRFTLKYLDENARKERMRVFNHAKKENVHRLIELLHTYQTSLRERMESSRRKADHAAKSVTARPNYSQLNPYTMTAAQIEAQLTKQGVEKDSDALEQAEAYITSEIFSIMRTGDWEALRWLADYGEKHCKDGIKESCKQESKNDFPPPSKALEDKSESGSQFAALILRSFSEAAGISVEDTFRKIKIHVPSVGGSGYPNYRTALANAKPVFQTADETHLIPVNRHLIPPKKLPSKAKLREVVLKKWITLGGAENIDSEFSRCLKRLGLGGLKNLPRGIKSGMKKLRAKLC